VNATVTDEMLDAAVRKAAEAGLIPRYACREDTSGYQDLIRYVLQAALDADQNTGTACMQHAAKCRNPSRESFAEVGDMTTWLPGYAQQ